MREAGGCRAGVTSLVQPFEGTPSPPSWWNLKSSVYKNQSLDEHRRQEMWGRSWWSSQFFLPTVSNHPISLKDESPCTSYLENHQD